MYRVDCTWDDAAHTRDPKMQADMLANYPPHLRDARSKGIPTQGAGAVYPIAWEDVSVPPMQIPAWWPRAYGLDVGWKTTAALWGALDRETDTLFVYSEHYAGQQVAMLHAEAIKARGAWIMGAIDPASQGRSQRDGEQLIVDYRGAGLNLIPAKNAVEAGIAEVWGRLATGRLKFFKSLRNTENEYMRYHREEDPPFKVVKAEDHAMDALRYLVLNVKEILRVRPVERSATRATLVADGTAGY